VDATAVPAPTPPATAPLEAADHSSSEGPVLRQQASPAEEAEFELAFWESIKDSREPAEAAHLERYPAGTFAALAETRRQTLLEEAAVTAADPAAADAEVSAVDVLRLPRALSRRGLRRLGEGSPRRGRITAPLSTGPDAAGGGGRCR
jgi:hypothetical protein